MAGRGENGAQASVQSASPTTTFIPQETGSRWRLLRSDIRIPHV